MIMELGWQLLGSCRGNVLMPAWKGAFLVHTELRARMGGVEIGAFGLRRR